MQYNVVYTPLDDTTSGFVNVVDGQRQFGRGRGNSSQGRGRRNSRLCSFCKRTNHIVETCYKKHGYPPNWGRGGGNSFANAKLVECEDTEFKGSTSIGKNDENGTMLTKDQYQNLIALLEKRNIESKGSANVKNASSSVGNTSWIVDTGATHHTCHDLSWFTTYTKIKPINVTFPNKNIVEACYRGNAKLSESLHIYNVLYLPAFAVNVIFVSKFAKNKIAL